MPSEPPWTRMDSGPTIPTAGGGDPLTLSTAGLDILQRGVCPLSVRETEEEAPLLLLLCPATLQTGTAGQIINNNNKKTLFNHLHAWVHLRFSLFVLIYVGAKKSCTFLSFSAELLAAFYPCDWESANVKVHWNKFFAAFRNMVYLFFFMWNIRTAHLGLSFNEYFHYLWGEIHRLPHVKEKKTVNTVFFPFSALQCACAAVVTTRTLLRLLQV